MDIPNIQKTSSIISYSWEDDDIFIYEEQLKEKEEKYLNKKNSNENEKNINTNIILDLIKELNSVEKQKLYNEIDKLRLNESSIKFTKTYYSKTTPKNIDIDNYEYIYDIYEKKKNNEI